MLLRSILYNLEEKMRNIIKLDHPAADWVQGLPLGNGRLGAMVQGQIADEVLFINEETLYYGGPKGRQNPDTAKYLGKIRELLFSGQPEEAEFLAKAAMTGTPRYLSPFQPAGCLRLSYFRHEGRVSAYSRILDIDKALAAVSYKIEDIQYNREYFTALGTNVLAISIRASAPITLQANLNRRPFEEHTGKIDDKTIGIWGRLGDCGPRYFGCTRALAAGGSCAVIGDSLVIKDAGSVVFLVSFSTDYLDNGNFREQTLCAVDEAERKGWEGLKNEHTMIYRSLYERVQFTLNDAVTPEEPTDVLLKKLKEGGNGDYLCLLDFNMGRYLLISSSYNCRMPANLQGIWNGTYTPPWESVFTININLQMNYWLAEVCNLSECTAPLFDLVDLMVRRGRETAKNLYGCEGFVAHHNTDIWGDTDPTGISGSSPFWIMGGAWLALHLYEHYRFTGDKEFLETRAFPVLEQALLFFRDYLAEDERGGLHTGPSVSPENNYITGDGQTAALCMSPAMDIEILRELYTSYAAACDELGTGQELRREMEKKINRLPEIKLTKDGRIREWLEDYGEKEPGHRHFSHLFALHPGSGITEKTPELFRAAEKTLSFRIQNGSGHTGWSAAWAINHWARLKNGDRAYAHLMDLLTGKTIENMLSVHPPFQIDGSFGLTAGVAEMLVQSHGDCCELLPALPGAWKGGRISGLRLRGGIGVEISWQEGRLAEAVLVADKDIQIWVKYGDERVRVSLKEGAPYRIGELAAR
jgi:alpha-L-fucosidase 2